MKHSKSNTVLILCSAAVFILILDSRTAILAAQEAVDLCLRTVIPSLFPMSVLTAILSSSLVGTKTAATTWLCKVCGLTPGTESIYLTGLIGGYPLGAKITALSYSRGCIGKQQAERLLAFCSNAGPAYIFGICGCLFSSQKYAWYLWAIQIISSMMVAILYSNKKGSAAKQSTHQISLSEAVQSSIKAMSIVSGWIILFRVLSAFLDKWLLFSSSAPIRSIIKCFLELTNGIISLQDIPNEGVRFIIASGALSFGGYCVVLQTKTLTEGLSINQYVIGKSLQMLFSLLIAGIIYYFCFRERLQTGKTIVILVLIAVMAVFLQKIVEISRTIIYNIRNMSRGDGYAVPKKDRAPL